MGGVVYNKVFAVYRKRLVRAEKARASGPRGIGGKCWKMLENEVECCWKMLSGGGKKSKFLHRR